jgi:hypothetical protein
MSKLLKYYTKNKEKIIFPTNFDEEINEGDILKTTKNLDLSDTKFNKKIGKNVIVNGIKTIHFSKYFNQKIEKDTIPESVEEIVFGEHFCQDIYEDTLPKMLKKLVLKNNIIKNIFLPKNLEEFEFKSNLTLTTEFLPNTLKKLTIKTFEYKLLSLPKSLEYLDFMLGFQFEYSDIDIILDDNILHENLKYLRIPQFYGNINNCIFPKNLEILDINSCEDKLIKENIIPNTVHTIKGLSSKHNLIINSLPETIREICFTTLSNNISNIPYHITTIRIPYKKNSKYLVKVPFDCKILTYGEKY